jgi:tryptophan synthase alpha chain
MYEYEKLYAGFFKDNNLSNIFMVTPQTSEERIRKIDQLSNSFIYLLSASIITGTNVKVSSSVEDYYKRIKAMQLKNPIIFGFGIADNKSFKKACEYARGAIVGSAFVKFLGMDNYLEKIPGFVESLRP